MARVTIYDVSGGEPVALTLWSVDAEEALRNDPARYSRSAEAKPADAADDGDDGDDGDDHEGDGDAPADAPRKRGRPRKVS